jgi:hypothetical protein
MIAGNVAGFVPDTPRRRFLTQVFRVDNSTVSWEWRSIRRLPLRGLEWRRINGTISGARRLKSRYSARKFEVRKFVGSDRYGLDRY